MNLELLIQLELIILKVPNFNLNLIGINFFKITSLIARAFFKNKVLSNIYFKIYYNTNDILSKNYMINILNENSNGFFHTNFQKYCKNRNDIIKIIEKSQKYLKYNDNSSYINLKKLIYVKENVTILDLKNLNENNFDYFFNIIINPI